MGCHFLLQGIFWPRKQTPIPGRFYTIWATRELYSFLKGEMKEKKRICVCVYVCVCVCVCVCVYVYSFPCSSVGKESACSAGDPWVRSLGWEDPLKKEMATHSSILASKISWTEEPGGLQSMGSQRVGHNWATNTYLPDQGCTLIGRQNLNHWTTREVPGVGFNWMPLSLPLDVCCVMWGWYDWPRRNLSDCGII